MGWAPDKNLRLDSLSVYVVASLTMLTFFDPCIVAKLESTVFEILNSTVGYSKADK